MFTIVYQAGRQISTELFERSAFLKKFIFQIFKKVHVMQFIQKNNFEEKWPTDWLMKCKVVCFFWTHNTI